MKSTAAFLLTCLSSVLLLSACSAIDKLADQFLPDGEKLPPVTQPPSPTVGAQANLGATVAVYVGDFVDTPPIGSPITDQEWVDQASYINFFSTPGINPDALFNYYGRVSGGASITTSNREFLFISASDDASRAILDSYIVLRNSSTPASVSPIIADYGYIASATVARITFAATLGTLATVNHQFSLGVSLGTVTAQILSNGLQFGDNTVTISGAYGAKLYGPNPSTNPAMSLAADRLFIEAEYAALYLRFDNTIADPTVRWGSTYSGGALTRQINIPKTGTLTYNIDHVIGAYTDGENLADNKLLYGNGNLMANFNSNMVSMNLTVYDHSGAKFMDVTNLGMPIRARGNLRVNDTDYAYYHRNQFFCDGSPSSRCTGSIDYADDTNTRLTDVSSGAITGSNAHGSFYGPNAEEVAGGFRHRDSSNNSEVNLGFIGKKQPSP